MVHLDGGLLLRVGDGGIGHEFLLLGVRGRAASAIPYPPRWGASTAHARKRAVHAPSTWAGADWISSACSPVTR